MHAVTCTCMKSSALPVQRPVAYFSIRYDYFWRLTLLGVKILSMQNFINAPLECHEASFNRITARQGVRDCVFEGCFFLGYAIG